MVLVGSLTGGVCLQNCCASSHAVRMLLTEPFVLFCSYGFNLLHYCNDGEVELRRFRMRSNSLPRLI